MSLAGSLDDKNEEREPLKWTEGLIVRQLENCFIVWTPLGDGLMLMSARNRGSEIPEVGMRIRCAVFDLPEQRKPEGPSLKIPVFECIPLPTDWSSQVTEMMTFFVCPAEYIGIREVKGHHLSVFRNELIDIHDVDRVTSQYTVDRPLGAVFRLKVKRIRPSNLVGTMMWIVDDCEEPIRKEEKKDIWLHGIVCTVAGSVFYISTESGDAVLSGRMTDGTIQLGTHIKCTVRDRPPDGHLNCQAPFIVVDHYPVVTPDGWDCVESKSNLATISCPARFLEYENDWVVLNNEFISSIYDMNYVIQSYCAKHNIIVTDFESSRVLIQKTRLRGQNGRAGWVVESVVDEDREGEELSETMEVDGIICTKTPKVLFVYTAVGDAVIDSRNAVRMFTLGTHVRCRIRPRESSDGHSQSTAPYMVVDQSIERTPEGWKVVGEDKLSCPASYSHDFNDWIVFHNSKISKMFDMDCIVKKYCDRLGLSPFGLQLFIRIQRVRLRGGKGVSGWVIVRIEEEEDGESTRNGEMQRKRDGLESGEREEEERRRRYEGSSQRRWSEEELYASSSLRPSTPESIDGFVIKKWGVYFVVWTPDGLALIFDDLSVKGKKAELGSFIQCKLGNLPSPILDRRLTYTQKVIDYSVEEIQRYGRGIVRGEHAVISCRIHFLEFRRRLLTLSSSGSESPSRNPIFKHPFLGEVVDTKKLIQNPAPGDSYQVIVKGIPINEFTIGWIVEREEGEDKERNERVEEERKERVEEERGGKEREEMNDNGAQSVAETTEIPSETASSVDRSQCFESLVRRAFSLQTVRDILKKEDEQLFSEIIDQLIID